MNLLGVIFGDLLLTLTKQIFGLKHVQNNEYKLLFISVTYVVLQNLARDFNKIDGSVLHDYLQIGEVSSCNGLIFHVFGKWAIFLGLFECIALISYCIAILNNYFKLIIVS